MSDVIIRARDALESVEPGDWQVQESGGWTDPMSYDLVDIERFRGYRNNVNCGSDEALAQFIADAHNTLLPELVEELGQLREVALETVQMFRDVEEMQPYYAPLHRMIDLLAKVAGEE